MTPQRPAGGPPRRAWVLGLWLALLAVGLAVIARTPFSGDLSAFLPATPDARQRVLVEQLQGGAASRLLLIGIEGGEAPARAAASRALAAALRASGEFDQVQNGERDSWEAVGAWLLAHRYPLSPAVTAERFTEAGLREAIDETLSLLGTPAGEAIKPLLERDPSGELQRVVEALIPAQAPRLADGVWVSRQAGRAILLAGTRAAGSDIDAQARAIETVRERFAAVAPPGLSVKVSGAGVFATLSRDQVKDEVIRLALEGTVLLIGLLVLAFGTLRAVGVAVLPVVTGVIAGVAGVSLVHGGVHGMTLGLGSTLIGEAVDYAIYYMIQARSSRAAGAAPGQGWRVWLAQHWPTVRLGLATSLCGFVVLAFSGFPGLAQLGVFSVCGLASAAATARFVLPLLMPDGAVGSRARAPLARGFAALLRHLPRLRPAVAVLSLAALAFLVWKHDALWRGDLLSLSPVPAPAIALDTELRADLGTSDARTLVMVRAAGLEQALQQAEAAGLRLDALVADGVIAGYDSPARLLPSQALQQARLAALPTDAALRRALAAATAGGPLPASRLEPFLADVAAARQARPLRLDDLDADPAAHAALLPLLNAQISHADGQWSLLIALHPLGNAVVTAPVEAALQGLPGVLVVDIRQSLDALYDTYLHEALGQAVLGALAVLALLGLWHRSLRRMLSVARPLIAAVLIVLAGLALLDVGLGILHLVGMLLVVALGSNYALFFDQLSVDGDADEDTLASLLFANLTAVGAFSLIALSSIPALSAIGQVVAPGALLTLLLSAVLIDTPIGRAGPAAHRGPATPR